jgi:hypothetical protein
MESFLIRAPGQRVAHLEKPISKKKLAPFIPKEKNLLILIPIPHQ